MYSRRIVAAKRANLEAALQRPLHEYSLTEVHDFKERLAEVDWSPGTEATLHTLPEDAARFVLNELALCPIDFNYWLRRYAVVEDKHGQVVPFVPRKSQQMLLDKFGELEESNSPYPMGKAALALVKARRVGGTALGQAMLSHGVLFHQNAKGLTGSDTPKNTLELFRLQTLCYDNLPIWLRPRQEGKVKMEHLLYPDLGSDLMFTFGDAKTSYQGKRIDFFHATEVSTWAYADMIDDDIMPMFDSSDVPTSFAFLETTGKSTQGSGKWFEDHFRLAMEGKGSFAAMFLGWFHVVEQHVRPAEGVTFNEKTLAVAERIKRHYGIECTREQLAWYQLTRESLEAKNKLVDFIIEYPTFWEDGFAQGFKSVFSLETQERVQLGAKEPLLTLRWSHDAKNFTDVTDTRKTDDPLLQHAFIFEEPRRGFTYVVGVDGSYGDPEYDPFDAVTGEKDPSAVEVLRVGTKDEPAEQVASFMGYVHPTDELPLIAEKLGKRYGDQTNENYPAMMACEVNNGSPSAQTQDQLLKRGYPHFYIWPKKNRVGGGYTNAIGWETTPRTRPWITSCVVKDIQEGFLVVNSPITLQQMKTFVKTRTDGGTVRIDHEPGHHDDSLFALGIADFVSQEQAAVYLAREAARLGEPDLEPKQKIDYQSTGLAMVDGKLTVITPGFLRGEDESGTYSYELPS
jgi:hypothetical protein